MNYTRTGYMFNYKQHYIQFVFILDFKINYNKMPSQILILSSSI